MVATAQKTEGRPPQAAATPKWYKCPQMIPHTYYQSYVIHRFVEDGRKVEDEKKILFDIPHEGSEPVCFHMFIIKSAYRIKLTTYYRDCLLLRTHIITTA